MKSVNPKVREQDQRPACMNGTCFYCHQKIGDPHTSKCGVLKRLVKVKYTFELEIEVPHYWTEGNILFHRNDGTWCAGNAPDDLTAFEEHSECSEKGCLCRYFKCEVLDLPEAEPYVGTKLKTWPKPEEN